MKKAILFSILFFLFQSNQVFGQELFDTLLLKKWEGTGTLMGSEATFKMNWKKTLGDNFIFLKFKNERKNKNGETFYFKAHAYYKVKQGGFIEGMWFDSRGIYFPLTGTLTKTKLLINWGTPKTEQGRTVYTITENNEIEVIDFILKNNEYLRFGNAVYK